MIFKASHKLMSCYTVWAEKIGTIATTRYGSFFSLARGASHIHPLNSFHIQTVSSHIVQRQF